MPRSYPVLQLRVTLLDSEPPIWRRVLVPANRTLGHLHDILQEIMDWEDYHLHQFIAGDTYYGNSLHMEMSELPITDEDEVRLDDLLKKAGDRIVYEYDFGDGWEHEVELEAVHKPSLSLKHAVCLAGERAGPPEDSGGVYGYMHLLEVLANPKDPNYSEMREWMPEDFDPEAFDLAEINARLQRL